MQKNGQFLIGEYGKDPYKLTKDADDKATGWSINNFVIGTVLLFYQNPYICISHKDFKNNLKKFMSKFVLKCGKDLFNVEHTPE